MFIYIHIGMFICIYHMKSKGILNFETGNSYIGHFKNNSFNGFGEFNWTSQVKSYAGYYKNDLKSGLGLYFSKSPFEIYFGFWSKGQKEGVALEVKDLKLYFSFWKNGKRKETFLSKEEAVGYCNKVFSNRNQYSLFLSKKNIEDDLKVFFNRRYDIACVSSGK